MGDPVCDVIVAMMRYSEIPRDFSSESLRFAEVCFFLFKFKGKL